MFSIRNNQGEIEKMSDDSSDLMQLSGETRITVNVQQISSRFQSMQVAAKEILKKCEQAVHDHRDYIAKYQQSSSWLATAQEQLTSCSTGSNGDLTAIESKIAILEQLLGQQQESTSSFNRVLEIGEKLYATTAVEGREAVRIQMQELQTAIEGFYDSVSSSERQLKAKRAK